MSNIDFDTVAREVLGHSIAPKRHIKTMAPQALPWLPKPIALHDLATVAMRPVQFAVTGLLMRGRAHLLTGLGGASKTTLLCQLGVGIATGQPVLGWEIHDAGDAVLVLAEDTAEDSQRLIYEILKTHELSDSEQTAACSRLHIFAAAGVDCKIVGPGNPESHSRLEQLIAFCRSLPDVRLIGLDPAIAFSSGRELDELDQRSLANAVEKLALETGASVVLVSHAAKSVQYQTEIGSHNSRGSGALTDALRLEMLLRGMTAKEAKAFGILESERQRFVRFQVTKANRLPPEEMGPRWFIRGEAGVLSPTQLEVQPESGKRVKPRELAAVEVFLELDETTGEIVPCSLKFSDWKTACADRRLLTGDTGPAQDMSARRLLQTLRDKKLVSQRDNGNWALTEQGKEAAHQTG